MGITRGGKGQILRSCGPGGSDHHAVIPKMLAPRGPGRGQLLAQHLPRISGVLCWKPWAAGAAIAGAEGCGEGWLSFQIHWFMEKPAREGQGAACLIIVIVLISRPGSEQDPTLRQVPHHPLPGICATIPSCPHHPSCFAPKVAPTSIPIPVRNPGSP